MKSKSRTKSTGEVFTPTSLVQEMLAKLPSDYKLPGKTVLDNSAGNSQFLAQVFIDKAEFYENIRDIKNDIFGVDLMADNVADSVARLAVLEKYRIDIIDESAKFKINHPEYADNHDHSWLLENYKDFSRRYTGELEGDIIDVTVTFEYFDDGNAGVFRYTFDTGTSFINPNIVCANALTYNYSFSKTENLNDEGEKMERATVCYDKKGRRYQDLYEDQLKRLKDCDKIEIYDVDGTIIIVIFFIDDWKPNKFDIQPGKKNSRYIYDTQIANIKKKSKSRNNPLFNW